MEMIAGLAIGALFLMLMFMLWALLREASTRREANQEILAFIADVLDLRHKESLKRLRLRAKLSKQRVEDAPARARPFFAPEPTATPGRETETGLIMDTSAGEDEAFFAAEGKPVE